MALTKRERRIRIKHRIRKKVNGTAECPRFTVFRSNRQITVQLIDDQKNSTILSASSKNKEVSEKTGINKIQQAELVGGLIAKKAISAGITTVVFDRSGYLYHGRVKAIAEAARKEGLKF